MKITDERGREIREATLMLTAEEVTQLLVAASQIDDGTSTHELVRDPGGAAVVFYLDTGEPTPIQRQLDWWLGPVLLFLAMLMIVGAFTVARGLVRLVF